ncbi:hypothetical protein D3C78_320300 [compost metagenome]
MSERDCTHAPLAELLAQVGDTFDFSAFAGILVERLRNGRADEVADFIGTLYSLYRLNDEQAPWRRDPDLWLELARLTVPRGVLLEGDARRGRELSREMQAMARDWLAGSGDRPSWEVLGLFRKQYYWFWYEGMPREEVLSLIEWLHEVRTTAGLQPTDYPDDVWGPLIATLDDADLLALAEQGGALYRDVVNSYRWRHYRKPTRQRWAPWHAFFERHPQLYDLEPVHDDPELIALRWAQGADETRRGELAQALLSYAERRPQAHFLAQLDRLVRQDPATFVRQLSERPYLFDVGIAEKIWAEQYPELLPLLLPGIVKASKPGAYLKVLQPLLAARPDAVLEIPAAKLAGILPLLEAERFRSLLPQLGKVLAGSSSKALREAMARAAQVLSPDEIAATGWLTVRTKNLQLACRDLLLAHPDPAAASLLVELLAGGGLDAGSASVLQARLQAQGLLASGAGAAEPASLQALEAQAAGVKRIAAAVKHYDAPELLALFAPLSEHATRVLLHLAATAEGELSPLAKQLLAAIPAENRARLSLALTQAWVALDGDPRQRWALKLVAGNADDRVVDTLVAAILAWGKPKKQRAVVAVGQLGALDTPYALARVLELSSSRRLKDLVIEATQDTLEEAARRRGLGLAELHDELTPDFGLGEGVTLAVGPHSYRVELQGDLSLRIVNDKGKASKSLPAVKDAALKPEWEAASARLKTLASGLKAVLKQQGPRLQAALMTGKSWPLVRWQRLFVQHPLLRIVGRSLIWRVEGTPLSFRIAEDFSLVDVNDDPVSLPADAAISLWHPASAEPGEHEAWQSYLDDYELTSLVEQVGAPCQLPVPAQCQGNELHPPAPLEITQGALSGLLGKWNYRPGPVGDGPGIYEHSLDLPAAQLYIQLHHDRYMPYMDLGNRVAIEHLTVYDTRQRDENRRWRVIPPADLPKPLQATLMGQLQAMAAKAAPAKGEA